MTLQEILERIEDIIHQSVDAENLAELDLLRHDLENHIIDLERYKRKTMKESRTSKIVISSIGFISIGILMFMLGRVSNNTRTSEFADESQSYNYTIESSYIPEEINF